MRTNAMNSPQKSAVSDAFHTHLKVFSDGWMLIIVSELLKGSCRFNELQRRACGISPVTLTARLKKLEQLGIVTRSTKIEDELSVTYCITGKGKAMEPVLRALRTYGEAHFGLCGCDD